MTTGDASLLDDPVAKELLASRIPARLAYVWTDGTPRVVPIWFHWTGDEVVFGTPANAPKTTALSDGDRVAVTIDGNDWPYHSLVVRGPARVTRRQGVVEEYALAANRYFGEEQGNAWLAQLPDDIAMVRIAVRPEHVTILDFETRLPSAISA
jgi:nitroimidazol reductase NimA-like FMN-containing flavoprotein (pyridoxamine 5'-phosphate oxidase superfamily)